MNSSMMSIGLETGLSSLERASAFTAGDVIGVVVALALTVIF